MANIILTGGNQGIGYFMAEKFLQNGDCVVVLDLENDNLRELKKEYPGRDLHSPAVSSTGRRALELHKHLMGGNIPTI